MDEAELALEGLLLRYGRQELELKEQLTTLSQRARHLVLQGLIADAEPLWQTYELCQQRLRDLQPIIQAVENKLYGLRRRRRF